MKNKFILLIEDNQAVREALVWSLEDEGYQVMTARNGQEGLNLLEKDPLPAIIILDLMMPVVDGLQFRARQKMDARIKNIPTVITSAKSNLEEAKKVLAPEEIILQKPFDLSRFYEIVKKYCD